MAIETIATLVIDKHDNNAFRVEKITDDGAIEVAIFAGPNALERAIFFTNWYDEWADPDALSEPSSRE